MPQNYKLLIDQYNALVQCVTTRKIYHEEFDQKSINSVLAKLMTESLSPKTNNIPQIATLLHASASELSFLMGYTELPWGIKNYTVLEPLQ